MPPNVGHTSLNVEIPETQLWSKQLSAAEAVPVGEREPSAACSAVRGESLVVLMEGLCGVSLCPTWSSKCLPYNE